MMSHKNNNSTSCKNELINNFKLSKSVLSEIYVAYLFVSFLFLGNVITHMETPPPDLYLAFMVTEQ